MMSKYSSVSDGWSGRVQSRIESLEADASFSIANSLLEVNRSGIHVSNDYRISKTKINVRSPFAEKQPIDQNEERESKPHDSGPLPSPLRPAATALILILILILIETGLLKNYENGGGVVVLSKTSDGQPANRPSDHPTIR